MFVYFSLCSVPGLFTPAVPGSLFVTLCFISATNLPCYHVDSKNFLLSLCTMFMVFSRFPPCFLPQSFFSCSSISFKYTQGHTLHSLKGDSVILLLKEKSVYLPFYLNLFNIYCWVLKSHLWDFRGICCPIPSHFVSLLLQNYDFFAESIQQNVFNVTGCRWSSWRCFIDRQWHTRLMDIE